MNHGPSRLCNFIPYHYLVNQCRVHTRSSGTPLCAQRVILSKYNVEGSRNSNAHTQEQVPREKGLEVVKAMDIGCRCRGRIENLGSVYLRGCSSPV